tara:strand:+ start:91 stop:645 length:555 start_codon:yes stop_codon:yes gene_type:complete
MIIPTKVSISKMAFEKHKDINEALLYLINKSPAEENINNNFNRTQIDRVDFNLSDNFERPWVKFLIEDLQDHFSKAIDEMGYRSYVIRKLWFQQYYKSGTHGWHIHHNNYTGVYFLEFKNSPATELIEQYEQKNKFKLDVKEGDIILFPSFIVHKAPENKGDRKTIISFNIDFNYPNREVIENK